MAFIPPPKKKSVLLNSYTLIIPGSYQECDGYCLHNNYACNRECAEGYVPCGNVNMTNICLKEEGEDNWFR